MIRLARPLPTLAGAALLLASTPAWAADDGGVNLPLVGGLVVLVVACAVVVAVSRAWGLVFTAGAGAVMSLYLTFEHLEVMHGGKSVCGATDVVDCASVLTSAWSEVGGVPVSLFGFAFYLSMGWLAYKLASGKGEDAPALLVVGAVIGVGFDVFLGAQMIGLGKLCILCLTTYGLNLVLLVGSTLASRAKPFGPSFGKALSDLAGIAVVVGLVGLIGGVFWYQGRAGQGVAGAAVADAMANPAATVARAPGAFYEQVGGSVVLDGTEPVWGDVNAKYTIVEWADFQCPHCARMWETLHDWLPANKDVKLVYKNYPISNVCNRFVGHEGHPQACGAALAARCAGAQGRFLDLASQMFRNQEYLSSDDLKFMVNQVGMDAAAYDTCMMDAATLAAVMSDVDAGGKANISGTPSLFVKGVVTDDFVRLNAMDKASLDVLFAAARSGAALPAPPPPSNP